MGIIVDFKETIWFRVHVYDKKQKSVLKAIKSGRIKSANDLTDFLEMYEDYSVEGHILETSEEMSVEQNHGYPTSEVIDEDDNSQLFSNADDSKKNIPVSSLGEILKSFQESGKSIEDFLKSIE
jgi:hypothetical protein